MIVVIRVGALGVKLSVWGYGWVIDAARMVCDAGSMRQSGGRSSGLSRRPTLAAAWAQAADTVRQLQAPELPPRVASC